MHWICLSDDRRFVNLDAVAEYKLLDTHTGRPHGVLVTLTGFPIDLFGSEALDLAELLTALADDHGDDLVGTPGWPTPEELDAGFSLPVMTLEQARALKDDH